MRTIRTFIVTVGTLITSLSVSAQNIAAQGPGEQPRTQIDAATRTQIIEAALKRLSDASEGIE